MRQWGPFRKGVSIVGNTPSVPEAVWPGYHYFGTEYDWEITKRGAFVQLDRQGNTLEMTWPLKRGENPRRVWESLVAGGVLAESVLDCPQRRFVATEFQGRTPDGQVFSYPPPMGQRLSRLPVTCQSMLNFAAAWSSVKTGEAIAQELFLAMRKRQFQGMFVWVDYYRERFTDPFGVLTPLPNGIPETSIQEARRFVEALREAGVWVESIWGDERIDIHRCVP
jgi:hypothetical protein